MKKQLMWLVQFWRNPVSIFKQVLVTKGTWMLPFMLIIFAMVFSRIYYYQTAEIPNLYMECQNNTFSYICPGTQEYQLTKEDAINDIEELSELQQTNMQAEMRSQWIFVLLFLPNALFAISFLMFMSERFFSKTRHTIGQWFAINNWCWLPLIISSFAYSFYLTGVNIDGSFVTSDQLDIFKVTQFLPFLDHPSFHLLFNQFSFMHLLAIFYMTVAFKSITENSWFKTIIAILSMMPAVMSFIFFIEFV